MSDNLNPYAGLQGESREQESGESFGAITEPMIISIKKASSWIRFLSICGWVYAGIIIVPSILFAVFMPLIDSLGDGAFSAELGISAGLFSVLMIAAILVIGAIFIPPLFFLHQFGAKLRTYIQTNNESALEIAFKNNTSFWKFCGILTIVCYALIPVSIVIAVVLGVLYV
jgi:hypothetical protein